MLLDKPFPPDPRVANEMRSLAQGGHEVHLVAPEVDRSRPLREAWEGTTVHRLPIDRNFYKKMSALVLRLPFYHRFFRNGFAPIVEEIQADAIHVHDLPLLRVGLEIGNRRRIPVVTDLHENYPAAVALYDYAHRWPGRWLISIDQWRRYEAEAVPRADHVITVVPEANERLLERVPAERITVVSNTVNVDEFEGFDRDPAVEEEFGSRFTIGYLGGFDRHRGLETAVDAMAKLAAQAPDYHLLLVGDGATRRSLEERVQALGIADRVSFAGWQPFRRFRSYVASCRVCLIPHLKTEHTDTTIPHKLFHYMLLERPVVSSNCAPLERVLRETEAGLVYPSGDADALARVVRQLRDDDLRAGMGERGRRAVLERYNWKDTEAALLGVYESLQAT